MIRSGVFILLLLFVFFLSGCIREDMSNCNYTRLMFTYNGDSSADIFGSKINNVDLFLFDEGGYFYSAYQINRSQLKNLQGINLSLPPGRYQVVCWGNATDNTWLEYPLQGSRIEDARIFNAVYVAGNTPTTNDSIYYAPGDGMTNPFFLTVPEKGQTSQTIEFKSANIKVDVYVKGFKDLSDGSQNPRIELTELYPGYDFSSLPAGNRTTYRQNGATSGTDMSYARFVTYRFDNATPTMVKIVQQSDNNTTYEFRLHDFLENNMINTNSKQELTITILIEFKDSEVTITVPNWNENPVKPGI